MIHNIASHIADNQTERDVNDVERFIHEAGERGRTWREVQRKFRRVKARDLREIFEGLEREGSIRVENCPLPTGGYPTKIAFPVTPIFLSCAPVGRTMCASRPPSSAGRRRWKE